MSKLKDYYFINDLFDRATAESYNGQTGYYNVNSNFFSSNWFWPDNAVENYRSALVALFDKEYDFSSDTNFVAHYDMIVFTYVNDDDIYFTFNSSYSWNGNPDSNEYYGCGFLQQSTAYLYKFDGTDITVVQNMGSASTYLQLPVYKVLVTTGAFVGAYPRHTIQANYLYTNGDVGNTSGGIHIPNPNPTRKIVINGSEPDDIKLNGVTPDKIMLNGQCYFEKAPEPDPHNYLYKWDFTKSLVDEKQGAEATYYGSNAASITRDSEGIHINNTNQSIYLCNNIELVGKTVEISISDYSPVNTPKTADEILCHCDDQRIYTTSYLYYTGSSGHAWNVSGYTSSNSNGSTMKTINTTMLPTELDNSVIKFIFGSETGVSVYLNDDLIGTASNVYFNADSSHASINNLYLLGKNSNSGANNWYNMTITGVRIYENEE